MNNYTGWGGTFDGRGNVAEPEQDGTTEWNAYWDPQAVKTGWDSDLTIQMVGLESTRQVPLTPAIRQHWATLRQHPAIDFIGQGYALVPALQHHLTNFQKNKNMELFGDGFTERID